MCPHISKRAESDVKGSILIVIPSLIVQNITGIGTLRENDIDDFLGLGCRQGQTPP